MGEPLLNSFTKCLRIHTTKSSKQIFRFLLLLNYSKLINVSIIQMLEMEEKKKQTRKEELEGVELRKAADEIFRRNEMEKMERYLEDNKKNKEYLFLQMVRSSASLYRLDF